MNSLSKNDIVALIESKSSGLIEDASGSVGKKALAPKINGVASSIASRLDTSMLPLHMTGLGGEGGTRFASVITLFCSGDGFSISGLLFPQVPQNFEFSPYFVPHLTQKEDIYWK